MDSQGVKSTRTGRAETAQKGGIVTAKQRKIPDFQFAMRIVLTARRVILKLEHKENRMTAIPYPSYRQPASHPLPDAGRARIALGVAALDQRLGGGLPRAALHEIYAGSDRDAAAASGFTFIIAGLAAASRCMILVRERRRHRSAGDVYAPGLAAFGIDPSQLFLVDAPDSLAALRAGADIARCRAVGAVIIALSGPTPAYDLTASRRLMLAAAETQVTTLLLWHGCTPRTSAAHSRWQVTSAAAAPLDADAPGAAVFDVRLLRLRGGMDGFQARLAWDQSHGVFAATLSGGGAAVAAGGTAGSSWRRAA